MTAGIYNIPNLLLTNPNKTRLAIIPQTGFNNLKYIPRFNALSELSFKIYNKITVNGETIDNPNYKLFKKKRLIYVDDLGLNINNNSEWFEINEATEVIEGDIYYKNIHCFSYEYTLNAKSVNLTSGTYKFYDEIDNTNTLLGKILKVCPSWSIGVIDIDLWNKERTFDVPDAKVYGFLMSDVEKAFECIFTFDNKNLKINATATKNIVKNTDILLTFNNLINSIEIKENANDIITALGVHGSGDLDIFDVNPLGSAMIYNFNYYKTIEWMSQDLIDAINAWETLVANSTDSYTTNLVIIKNLYNDLILLQTELNNLQVQLNEAETERSDIMTLDMSVPANITTYNNIVVQINILNSSIVTKQSEITTKQNEITPIATILNNIHTDLSFDNNFTLDQLLELDKFIFEGNYRNENYVITDEMNMADIRDIQSELFTQSKNAFVKLSQPMYTFSMNTLNLIFIEKFKPFVNQLELGSLIKTEVKPNEWVSPILLEMSIDYDNPDDFSMTFGNRFRLDTAEWTFGDLYNEQSKTSSFVNVNADLMTKPVKSGLLDKVSQYMTDNLNLANQMIVNAENQSFVMGEFGLWGKKVNYDGSVDPNQIRITNNIIAMTDDNWETLKLAIGVINGKTSILADVIVGKLLAGNDLYITNANNTFRIDQDGIRFDQTNAGNTFNFHVGGDGVTIRNGSIVLENTKNKITLDSVNGIKIQKYEGTVWNDKFYVDTNGNIVMNGIINSTSGNIGGFNIGTTTLSSNNGIITLNSIGTIKIQKNNQSIEFSLYNDFPSINFYNSTTLTSFINNYNNNLGITSYYGSVSIQAAANQGVLLTGGSIGLNSANISLGYGGANVSVNGSLTYNSQTLSLIAAYDRSGNPIVVMGYYG